MHIVDPSNHVKMCDDHILVNKIHKPNWHHFWFGQHFYIFLSDFVGRYVFPWVKYNVKHSIFDIIYSYQAKLFCWATIDHTEYLLTFWNISKNMSIVHCFALHIQFIKQKASKYNFVHAKIILGSKHLFGAPGSRRVIKSDFLQNWNSKFDYFLVTTMGGK